VLLKSLSLKNFRNFNELSLDTSAPFVVFHGDNGQGKTNLIEAICTLSTLKSFRSHRISEQIQWGHSEAEIRGVISDEGHHRELSVRLNKSGRKALLDGKPPEQLAEYFESIRAVVFAPEHVELVRGSPQQRRAFLDRGCFTQNPYYLHEFRSFRRLLDQRAALLRNAHFDLLLIESIEEKLAHYGARIAMKREAFIENLSGSFIDFHQALTGSLETNLEIKSCLGKGNLEEKTAVYTDLMAKKRIEERQRGSNLVGPQRDDLLIELNGKNARAFASQGQARALVLSMKLAELDLARKKGAKPLFLLDDLSSELDSKRRHCLLEILNEKTLQVFVSTTSLSVLEFPIKDSIEFQVFNGEISPS